MSPKSVEERLASMETTMYLMNETWQEHNREDNEFRKELDLKVDKLLLEQARDEGERRANRRLAGFVSFVVSTGIGVLTVACNYFL